MISRIKIQTLNEGFNNPIGAYCLGHVNKQDFLEAVREEDETSEVIHGIYPSTYEVQHDYWAFEEIPGDEWSLSVRSCSDSDKNAKPITYWKKQD